MQARVADLEKKLASKDDEIARLQHNLNLLRRHVFGKKSEKVVETSTVVASASSQLVIDTVCPLPIVKAPQPSKESTPSKPKGHGRQQLPKHLPVERVEIKPEQTSCACGGELKPIGEETSRVLEYVPASYFIRELARVKVACRKCQEGVVIADAPARPIEKGLAGPGLLAHVLVSKYVDHLPLNRLEDIASRHGVELSRQTMSDWVVRCAAEFQPIVEAMKKKLLASPALHTDDTPIQVLNPGKGKTHRGYMWTYQDDAANAVFHYTRTRAGTGPASMLEGYQGYVQADAYSGYHALFEGGQATEVGCWAHARRRFFDALLTEPKLAAEMLALIGELYRVEHAATATGLGPEARKGLRNDHSRPVIERISSWLEARSRDVLPKSPLGVAITYARNQWKPLTRFLEDGRLKLDNNTAERALRPVAVGRKNWLFAGSDKGGEAAATIYSLVYSAKLLGLDPWRYLRDVLDRLATHPASAIDDLTPAGYAAALREKAIAVIHDAPQA